MLLRRALLSSRLPQRVVRAQTRSNSVFGSFKEKLNEELKKNPELQKTLDELREGAAPIAKGARDAATKVSSTVTESAVKAEEAAKQAAEAAKQAAEAAKQAANAASQSEMAQKAQQAAQQAREAVNEASTKASEAAGKAGEKAREAAGKAGETEDGGAKDTGSGQLPLYARLMDDVEGLIKAAKEKLFENTGAAMRKAPGPIDTSSTEMVIKEPTFWEKANNTAENSQFLRGFRGFFGAAGDAAGAVGDRVMGETEQAEAMLLLRETIPSWKQEEFLEHIRAHMAPQIIGAYLKGDMDVLRKNCREQAFAQLNALVQEREARQLLMDQRILHMSEPELEGIRIISGMPTPVVSFETHQLHCIRSRLTAAIVEGDEDDIRSVHYLWALQPNDELTDETPAEEQWQVTELAVRGMMSTY